MMRLLFAGLVAASVLLGQATDGASIEGQVLNSLTAAPLRKAVVILTSSSAPIRLTANTDPQGRFQFTGLPAGTYRLSATHSGFQERLARRPVAVAANAHVTDAEIRLPPQGVIT